MASKRLERIEVKLDNLIDHVSNIDVTLGAQHVTLQEHIKRTEILEKTVAPVKRNVNLAEGAIKLIALASAIAAAIEMLLHR